MFPLIVIATIFFLSVVGWSYVIGRWRRGRSVLNYEIRTPVPWTGIDIPLLFIPVILAVIARVVSIATAEQIAEEPLPAPELAEQLLQAIAANAAVSCIFVAALVTFVKLFRHASWRDLGFDRRKLSRDLQLGAAAFATVAPPVYVLQALLTRWYPPEHPLVTVLQQQPTASAWLLCAASAVIVAPIYEELMFRVLLQGWLEKVFDRRSHPSEHIDEETPLRSPGAGEDFVLPVEANADSGFSSRAASTTPMYAQAEVVDEQADNRATAWLPILFSSALFALLHLGQGPAPIPLFFLALALGYVYQRTHRVLPCIVLHALLNGTSLAMLAAGAE